MLLSATQPGMVASGLDQNPVGLTEVVWNATITPSTSGQWEIVMSEDGEPAFPNNDATVNRINNEAGMTLRDYFAAKAMQGWMASYSPDQTFAGVSAVEVASLAYRVANEMLKARVM